MQTLHNEVSKIPRPSSKDAVSRLIFELSKLPGIGEKTAMRLSYFILKQEETYARALSEAILQAKQKTGLCNQCFNFSDSDTCRICSNPERDHCVICVVEKPSEVLAIEQTGVFHGTYHVLHGALSPLDGIGPEELKIKELVIRLGRLGRLSQLSHLENPNCEIILATNTSVEGETTALYLTKLFKPMGIRLTQLAHGLPVGSLLEYTDKQTVGKALENRMEMI